MKEPTISRRGVLRGALGLVLSSFAGRTAHATEPEKRMPVLFISHGSPRLPIDPVRSGEFRAWGRHLPRPRGIVVMTPHFASRQLQIGPTGRGLGMYDMPGWLKRQLPQDLDYPSPPSEGLARRVEQLLAGAETVKRADLRGFTHTAWMPLSYLYPAADVPVLQISYPYRTEPDMFALGRRLAPLREEGILFIGSGQLSHNLASFKVAEHLTSIPSWAREFDAWGAERLQAQDVDALIDFRHKAPAAELNHPDDGGHFRMLLITLGVVLGGGGAARYVRFPVIGYESSMSKRCVQMA